MAKFASRATPAPTYPEDTAQLTDEHRVALAQRLSCNLSPENLSCDGELRGAELQAKAKLLYKAKEELEALGTVVPSW